MRLLRVVDGKCTPRSSKSLGHQVWSASRTSLISYVWWSIFSSVCHWAGPIAKVRPGFLFLEVKDTICASTSNPSSTLAETLQDWLSSSESCFGCSVSTIGTDIAGIVVVFGKKLQPGVSSEVWGIVHGAYAQYALATCSNNAQTFLIVVEEGWHDSHRWRDQLAVSARSGRSLTSKPTVVVTADQVGQIALESNWPKFSAREL